MGDSMTVLEAHGLTKRYRQGGRDIAAVNGVSLSVASGEVLAFLGPNGAGKTTTIKMIAGLVVPDVGSVRVLGEDPLSSTSALRHLGAVLEGNRNIYWRLTPLENLVYFGMHKGLSAREAHRRALALLEAFGLASKRTAQVQTLSRGMQQKVAIAVAMIHRPKVLMLDEPTLGLDVEAAESVKAWVRQIAAEGCAVLLTTHQLDVAQQLSERVAIIRDGVIIAERPTQALLREFTGDTYVIELASPLTSEQRERLQGCKQVAQSDAARLVYTGEPDGLYRVLQLLEPAPLLRVAKDSADLTAVFLRLVKEPRDVLA